MHSYQGPDLQPDLLNRRNIYLDIFLFFHEMFSPNYILVATHAALGVCHLENEIFDVCPIHRNLGASLLDTV